jgi:hypothetical protein
MALQREFDFHDDPDFNDNPRSYLKRRKNTSQMQNLLKQTDGSNKHMNRDDPRITRHSTASTRSSTDWKQMDDAFNKNAIPDKAQMNNIDFTDTENTAQQFTDYNFNDQHCHLQDLSHQDSHELEYHDDVDDEFYKEEDGNLFFTRRNSNSRRLTSSLPSNQISLLEEESQILSISADSSNNDIILITSLSSGSTSSSDSQRTDSFYENIASAMSSYVASLPLSSKLFINHDDTSSSQIWQHAGQQQQQQENIHHPTNTQHGQLLEGDASQNTITEPAEEHVFPTNCSSDDFGLCDLVSSIKELTCSEVATCTSELFGITTTIAVCNGVEVSTFSAMALSAIAGGVLCGPLGFVLGASAIGFVAGYRQISTENRAKFRTIGKKNVSEAIHVAKETTVTATNCVSKIVRDTNVRFQECSPYTEDYFPLGGRRRKKIYGAWNTLKAAFKCDQIDDCNDFESSQSVDLNTLYDAISLLSTYDPHRQGIKIKVLTEKESEIRIIAPVEKIHSLPPHLHVVAWMSVLSSTNRSIEEKCEALNEILVLIKDKKHAKRMLEQGILDIILSILSNYFQLLCSWLRQRTEAYEKDNFREICKCQSVATLEKTLCDLYPIVYLTSQCCVALGKSHCALITNSSTTDVKVHCPYLSCFVGNELDQVDNFLLNMSIPDWQKLARLLYEVPHSIRITQDEDNDDDDDDDNNPVLIQQKQRQDLTKEGQQLLVRVQWTVLEAQDVARLIACLETGFLDPRMVRTDPECLTEALKGILAHATLAF